MVEEQWDQERAIPLHPVLLSTARYSALALCPLDIVSRAVFFPVPPTPYFIMMLASPHYHANVRVHNTVMQQLSHYMPAFCFAPACSSWSLDFPVYPSQTGASPLELPSQLLTVM